jgi:hypothetical protein
MSFMPSVIMVSVIMPSVVMVSVVAPQIELSWRNKKSFYETVSMTPMMVTVMMVPLLPRNFRFQ